ncbi:hypothetical protein TM7_0083 [candidate division TM7 genomosp. GTL1]|nr:hypothetical protein TM7_0083 [candidate division TM7 genomosp. GTL1]
MLKNKLLIGFTAAVMALVMTMPALAISLSPGRNYGVFKIQVDLGKKPPAVAPKLDPNYVGASEGFTLSDDKHFGTFIADFKISALNTPAFDTFKVKNETSLPVVFGYVHEDQNIQPVNSSRQLSELLACFNALCDTGAYFPAGTLVPPVPLGTLAPHSTTEFKVGMKLSPLANRAAWNGTGLTTTLYFKVWPKL